MVNQRNIEPGGVQLLQAAMVLRLLLSLGMFAFQLVVGLERMPRVPLVGVIDSIFLLAYLSWPWLRKMMGWLHLPLGLAVISLSPILENALGSLLQLRLGVDPLLQAGGWQLIVVLMIPLVVIGWQYNLVAVAVFIVATNMADITLAIVVRVLGGEPALATIILVGARTLLYMLVAYMVNILAMGQRRQQAAMEGANAKLTRYAATLEHLTISRERNRMARELHDTLAHSLSAVAVQLEAAQALLDANDTDQARVMVERSLSNTRSGLNEARRAIRSLRAAPLEDLGLSLAIRSMAEQQAERAGLALTVDAPAELEGIGPEVEQCIYRVAEEALANVVRHSQARRLHLALKADPDQVRLTVRDDGRGFDRNAVPPDGHFGLLGMHERAALVKGELTIQSAPGKGTLVQLTTPKTAAA